MDEQLRGYRRDRIADYLKTYTEAFLARSGPDRSGLDASGAAASLDLDRANVSRDLNALYRDGIAIKLLGKPTRYLHHQTVAERFPDRFIPNTVPIGHQLRDYLAEEARFPQQPPLPAPGATLVESRYPSLHLAAVQAESAVQYPPHGLHTLLLGPFGSGKYGFAKQMFAYGKAVGKFSSEAKFYTFDASSFGSSAQSLIIQLFGCAAGVTSPSAGRKGLVERAEGGLLLLSEAQALPPPVQEKLIHIMMYGTYTRFGEASVNRPCKALLVATCSNLATDPPQAPLLKYFPMQITLPALSKRTAGERFLYLYQLFQAEAKALDCEFHVHRDVFYLLLCTTDSGDFITLRGVVKSVCSMACREALSAKRRNVFPVDYRHLPLSVQTCAAAPPSAADFYALLDRYPQERIVVHVNSIPLAPSPPARGADPAGGGLSPDASGFLFIKKYLDEYLRAASEAPDAPPDKNRPLTAQILRRVGEHPILGALAGQDPLIQGLASLLTDAIHADLNYQILQSPEEARALSAIPSELRLTALSLERDLCRLFGGEPSQDRASFIALYLYFVQNRLRSPSIRLFFLFHGRGVSEGLAAYVDKLYGCAAVPLGFDENSTSESLRAELDAALSVLPADAQVLLFTDGLPFQSLQEYIEQAYGLPAKNLCGATFETVLRTVRNVVRFHFTLDMIDDRPGAAAEAPVPAEKTASLVTQAMQGVLAPSLSFLDVNRLIPLLEDSLSEINRQLGLDGSDNVSIRYQFHCAHMIERLIRKEPLDYPRLKAFVNSHSREFRMIGQALQPIAQTFGIKLPASELAYLVELFLPS